MFITDLRNSYLKNKQLINNITGTYLLKGVSLLISFFTLPAYLRYFSDQSVLGVWFTILSVLQWILTFDLGIGNGLRNKLVPVLLKNEKVLIKKYISSTYIIIGIISLFTMIFGSVLIIFVNWNLILNVSTDTVPNGVLKTVIIIIFIGIVLQFFLKLITSILFAMQKTALSNSIFLISSVLILLYVIFFKTGNIEVDFINLAIVNTLAINIPLFVATFIIFFTVLNESRPSISFYDKKFAYSILRLGGNFFWIQLALLFINSTNEMLITWIYGPEYVVEYQVYNRLFYFVVTIFSLIANPVWSAITEAFAKQRFNWIFKLNKKLNLVVLLFAVCNFVLVVISQYVVNIWLKDEAITINYGYASIFVIFSAISMYNIGLSCFANGMGVLKCQVFCYTFAAIAKIPIVIFLSFFIEGWICVILVNALIMLPYSFVQPRLLKRIYKMNVASL